MKRIILDTRSNRFIRGRDVEQNCEQRAGLCQVGEGHLVVTRNPIDPEYLDYWKQLGFTLPHFITVGTGDPRFTLSELLLQRKEVQAQIKAWAKNTPARLEFGYIESCEAEVARLLEIPAYCNFDLSLHLSRKIPFKNLCATIGLPTPIWWIGGEDFQSYEQIKDKLRSQSLLLIKMNEGTGGISCGSMFTVRTVAEFEDVVESLIQTKESFLIEEALEHKSYEVAVHWEIQESGEMRVLGVFEQLSQDWSYIGVAFPSLLPQAIEQMILTQLQEQLGPYLLQQRGLGYYCCDLIIDQDNQPSWIDFNPRKGAIIYVWEMVRRLANIRFQSHPLNFWREDFPLPPKIEQNSFARIAAKLHPLLEPREDAFVVIINPGIIPFNHIELVGISKSSRQAARAIFEDARKRLLEEKNF